MNLVKATRDAVALIQWPAPDAWERMEPKKTQLMREWAVAAAACQEDKLRLLELMFELGLESGVASPKDMSAAFARFLLANQAPKHLGDLGLEALWYYTEGRKKVSFNS